MMKLIRCVAVAAIVVLVAGWALVWAGVVRLGPDGRLSAGVALPAGVSIGGPFALEDTTGKPVTDASFHGKWLLIYFGYTFCPDVCPTELQTVANALDLLGPVADQVAPVFVTVDPARDTPAALGEYVKMFSPRLVGLTGSAAQIADIERAYRVYAERVDSKSTTDYLMNHSSFIYLMDPAGHFSTLFRQGSSAQDIADALRARVGHAS